MLHAEATMVVASVIEASGPEAYVSWFERNQFDQCERVYAEMIDMEISNVSNH